METQKRFSILNYQVVLFAFGLLFSCEQLAPVEEPVAVLEEFEDLSGLTIEPEDDPINGRLVYTSDCESDCIEPGSGNYFAIKDSKSQSSGINTKKVSYKAYNTEDKFLVKVKYEVTSGPSQAKASIAIQINGKKKEFKAVPSGYTATFSIQLDKGWDKCDEMTFSIVQKGLGTPISFSGDYHLILICEDIYLGKEFGGGIIAYIFQQGDPGYDPNEEHGIIVSKEDLEEYSIFGCQYVKIGPDRTEIGTGFQNTNEILQGCTDRPIAASIAREYDGGGYNDWFLPSRDELKEIWLNKDLIGGFYRYGGYWSSSEMGEEYKDLYWFQGQPYYETAWSLSAFDNPEFDDTYPRLKYNLGKVRAARYF